MVGMKRSIEHVTDNAEENPSVPPGFESLTSLKLKKIVTGAVEGELQPELDGALLSNSDIERFKTSFVHKPWICHGQFERVGHQHDSEQIGFDLKDKIGASLRKGVIRGCPDCDDCVKVTARWHPEESYLPMLHDAPVFNPTEEEFKDTLAYIANIRPRAEKYGICRIVPPPSWRPPFILKNKEKWETSKFSTHVQKIDGLRNSFYQRKRSRLHENIKTEVPNDAARAELVSCSECVGDSEEAKASDLVSDFESGPEFTLKNLERYADDFKVQYFRENDTAAGQNQREPLIARIESEYWRIVDNPSEEIEVLFGADLANQTISSGFPTASTSAENIGKYNAYVQSGWNLNNTPDLYGSLIRFGRHNSSTISVPQMFIGMCFASQSWRTEDHHLYSLSYMHMGSPKVWYSIPGKYCFEFAKLVKKRFPKLSKDPKLLLEFVPQISPFLLLSEGIPVFRCLQNPMEFVVTFPGVYHSEFSCGFNCSEAVCFAPLDWLPHGQNIVEVYTGYRFKTSLSHDKLLLKAAMEAVASLWDVLMNKTDSSKTHLWNSVSGKTGAFTTLLKLRVESESTRRKHLCNTSMCIVVDESEDATKRECCVCLYDLYLSFAACSCSPNRYTCLRHMKQLCHCGWNSKQFTLRYEITELNLLVEALEGNWKAIYVWANKSKKENPNAISSKETNGVASVDVANGVRQFAAASNSRSRASGRKGSEVPAADDNVVILLSDEED